MKIILVGASGTIGQHLFTELAPRHEVIRASRNGDVTVDITSRASIEAMFTQVGPFDALVSATGGGHFGPLDTMTEEDFYKGIRSKLMGQVNLVMVGKDYINDNGSFTLVSGILADDPIRNGVNLSVVNGALNAFAVSAAVELKRGLRLNVVCPGLVEDSEEELGSAFPGHIPVSMKRVVYGYLKSVEGVLTGEVIRIY
ncbi:short chain dehydrogenase [Spirosoma soli]|uniref:Short chain dehydrogenase n=1 Tax=Spirosoma soli TaxID=1770529 RepID=A0ABW5LZY8_9BACT